MSTFWINNISKFLLLLICTSVAGHKIFRLEGGQTPYEGRVSVHLKDTGWMQVCSDGWNTDGADVICNELGFSAGAMWVTSPRVEDKTITSRCVYDVSCSEGSKSWVQCYYDLTHEPCNCKQAKTSCNYYGYRGCYNLGNFKGAFHKDADQLTIQECLRFCRKYYYRFGAVLDDTCKCFDSYIEDRKRGSNAICGTDCGGDDNHACGGTFPYYGVYDSQMGACGGKYSANNGTIYSPQFPGCYHGKSNCSWSVTSIEGHVSLDFTIFNFSDENFEIVVTEEHNGGVTVLGKYNKTSPPTSIIHSHSESTLILLNMVKESSGCAMFAIDFEDKVSTTETSVHQNSTSTEITDKVPATEISVQPNLTSTEITGKVSTIEISVPPNSTSTEITESTPTIGLEDAGSGFSLGWILGPVLGVTAFVLLLIMLCCRLTKKRDSEQAASDEPANTNVHRDYLREEELQYDARDEIYECLPATYTRPLQKITDTSEKAKTNV